MSSLSGPQTPPHCLVIPAWISGRIFSEIRAGAWPSAHPPRHPFLSCFCSAPPGYLVRGRPAASARQDVASFQLGQEAIPPAPVPGLKLTRWF